MSRVVVDRSRCASLGVCESLVPDLFELNTDGEMVLTTDGVVDHAHRDAARSAVARCPTEALRLVEE
jgi:ferredoxin